MSSMIRLVCFLCKFCWFVEVWVGLGVCVVFFLGGGWFGSVWVALGVCVLVVSCLWGGGGGVEKVKNPEAALC